MYRATGAEREEYFLPAPDSLEGFAGDLFRDIALYDNRATYTKTENGRYRVTLTTRARKQQADSIWTSPMEAPMDFPVEIGVFAEAMRAPRTSRRSTGASTGSRAGRRISRHGREKPSRAGVAPFTLLIDRETEDNMTAVTQAE